MTRRIPLLLLGLTGCARGCEDAPPPAPVHAPAAHTSEPTPNQKLEHDLGLTLPERRTSEILPGLKTLPWRTLPAFDPAKALVVRLDPRGLQVLDDRLPADGLTDAAVRAMLRKASEAWRLRAGVQANRLVLAVDADTPPERMVQLRREALVAAPWRVVALAKDGGALVELALNPPPLQRPQP